VCVDTGLSWLCVSGSTTIHVSSGIVAIAIGHLLNFTFFKAPLVGRRAAKDIWDGTSNVNLNVQPNEGWLPCCAQLLTLRRNIGSQRAIANGTSRMSEISSSHIAAQRDHRHSRRLARVGAFRALIVHIHDNALA
jgi:hypothetical protein